VEYGRSQIGYNRYEGRKQRVSVGNSALYPHASGSCHVYKSGESSKGGAEGTGSSRGAWKHQSDKEIKSVPAAHPFVSCDRSTDRERVEEEKFFSEVNKRTVLCCARKRGKSSDAVTTTAFPPNCGKTPPQRRGRKRDNKKKGIFNALEKADADSHYSDGGSSKGTVAHGM